MFAETSDDFITHEEPVPTKVTDSRGLQAWNSYSALDA
jgi:hypothetical protein